MSDVLICVERASHAAAALASATQSGGIILALSPEVMEVLDHAGVAYRVPEDFIDSKSLHAIGRRNYEYLEELGQWTRDWLKNMQAEVAINPVHIHYYRLKLFLDSISLRVMEIAAVIRSLRPMRIIAPFDPEEKFFASLDQYEFITPEGPVYAHVVPFVAKSLSVEVELLPCSSRSLNPERSLSLSRRIRAWSRVVGDVYALLRCICDHPLGKPRSWSLGKHSHDMPHIMQSNRRSGGYRFRDISFWARPVGKWVVGWLGCNKADWTGLEKILTAGRSSLRERLIRHPLCMAEGISFFPLIESPLYHLFSRGIVEAERCYRAAKQMARSKKVRSLLAVHTGHFRDVALTQALRDEGVPVIYAQEGGLYGYCESPMHHYMELAHGDYFLAYGPGVVSYLAATRLTGRQEARPLAVGGLRFKELRKHHGAVAESAHGHTRVMYTPTTDFHHNLRYAPLTYSDREYYRMKRRVLETLVSLPNVRVTYKIPPGSAAHDTCLAFVSEHRGRITVLDEPLPAVLDKAEIFLVDWPTTVLLEVLTTAKPVLVLIDPVVCRPIPEAMALLRRRALVSDSIESFVEMARSLIKDREGTLKNIHLTDTAFLDAYGTGGEAGWTAAQLARFFASV